MGGSGWDLTQDRNLCLAPRLSLPETVCAPERIHAGVFLWTHTSQPVWASTHMYTHMPGECGHDGVCADAHVYVHARECVGITCLCAHTHRRKPWLGNPDPLSQASTSAPWGPESGEQTVPKSWVWDGGFCQISAPPPLS